MGGYIEAYTQLRRCVKCCSQFVPEQTRSEEDCLTGPAPDTDNGLLLTTRGRTPIDLVLVSQGQEGRII